MSSTVQVSGRGALTLPKSMRKRLGLEDGGSVMLEENEQGILLRPAVSYAVELYSDSRVKEIDAEDAALNLYLEKKARK